MDERCSSERIGKQELDFVCEEWIVDVWKGRGERRGPQIRATAWPCTEGGVVWRRNVHASLLSQ